MKNFIVSIIAFGITFVSWGQGEFVTVWDLSKPGAQSTEIRFNAEIEVGGALYSWQVLPSGTAQIGLLSEGSGLKTISGIPAGSTIRLVIQPNNLNRFFMSFAVDHQRLIDVEQWGTTAWTSMENAFQGCSNLNISASDIPNLTNVNSMNRMFDFCTVLNSPNNINSWNTSNVTQMWRTFSNASQFNQPIGNWNVQNVENMAQMFMSASAFNQPIGNWNTANVINMEGMFGGANSFNQPIGSWNTGNVTDMNNMFVSCLLFNQSIENWNVSNVNNMASMFFNATSFNQPLSDWNVSNVVNMGTMFQSAISFNSSIGNWDVSNVTNMSFMFENASAFNQPIGDWDVSNVTNMAHMFENALAFNQYIGDWNVGNVQNFSKMFKGASSFNQNISIWNTGQAWDMNMMFMNATSYNQPMDSWNVSNVSNMSFMFQNASNFNQPLNSWNVSNVNNMWGMFAGATSFNQPLNSWNVSNVSIMQAMFFGASLFNQPLSDWNVSNVVNMGAMFHSAISFNQPLSNWNTNSATWMKEMFKSATSFNQPIGNWNTANVTSMEGMFASAISFNQPLSNWNVSQVTFMQNMFDGAVSFDQSLGSWQFIPNVNLINMLRNCGMSCSNYSLTLIGWAANNPTITNRNLFIISLQYNQYAVNARNQLLAQGWSINDGGQTNCNDFITRWNMNNPGQQASELRINLNIATGGAAYFWETIPSGTSGSGTLIAGTGVQIISGIPAGSIIRLSIAPENLNAFSLYTGGDRQRLIVVEQWGSAQWTSAHEMFRGCNNLLNITAPDTPDWSNCQNMGSMFRDCHGLITINNINNWNTSNIVIMRSMFYNALNFNSDIGNWNTTSVISMDDMFRFANQFNQDLSSWNVSAVIDMSDMFRNASNFNQSIGSWTLNPNVILISMLDICGMDCETYAQTLMGWQQNNPTVLNRNLGAQNMVFTFGGQAAKNHLVSNQGWTIYDAGLGLCEKFTTVWDLSIAGSGVDQIQFYAAGDLSISSSFGYTWSASPSGLTGSGLLSSNENLKTISGLPAGNIIHLEIFPNIFNRFYMNNGPDRSRLIEVSRWGSAAWTSMENAFYGCNNLQITAPFPPDLSDVTSMKNMFRECQTLNNVQNINSWDVSNVTNMESLFQSAASFNQNINSWNTGNVTNMNSMFLNAQMFNQNINNWNTSSIEDMGSMFNNAISFNQPLNNWNVSSVTNMGSMFRYASSFNQPLNNWNVSLVENMSGMFSWASSFNQYINSWNLSSVNNMASIFRGATSFNQPLDNWDVSNVTNMISVFHGASSFNQPLHTWNVSSVTDMSAIFNQAIAFNNESLASWYLNPNVNLSHALTGSGLDCSNYGEILAGWASNNPSVVNRNLGAANVYYSNHGSVARNLLINSRGWTISDAGLNDCGEFITDWNMNQPGSGSNQISFTTNFSDSVAFAWEQTNSNGFGFGYFASQGNQTISNIPNNAQIKLYISSKNLEHFSINNGPDRLRLTAVEKWGDVAWTSMEGMFYGCNFSQIPASAGTPQTSQVLSTKNMFRNCSNLQTVGDLNSWNMESVTNMESMFQGCANFTENIADWDVSSVNNMKSMFEGASSFNSSLGTWNVGQVQDFSAMFKGASALNQSLNAWNTSAATNMASMFENAVLFNSDLDNWGTSSVSDMQSMFKNAALFNGNITTWETQNVSDMSGMFEGAVAFNRDLSNWVTSQVTNMSNMFRGAAIFDQELNSWDVSNVTNFSGMFRDAPLFKRDLNNWSTQNGSNFSSMFNGASFFDGEVSAWNTSAAQNMSGMFANTNSFNRDISAWDVALVVDFSSMFQNALGFNRNLGSWDLSNAENLSQMFDNAPQFNADLSLWDVSNVELMNSMFDNAVAFNQNLGTWILNPQVQMSGLLNYSGLDCNNYSATLQGWYLNNPGIQGINLGAQNMTYNGLVSSVRDELINNQGWSITGDAQVATNPYVLSPGEQFSAQLACYGEFTRIDDPSLRLVMLDPNGNNLDFNTVAVEALNDFITPSNTEIITVQSTGNGYYQISDGTNTFRVGSRLFKIEVPGNFTVNGGVRVRLYYEQDDFSGMLNDVPPSGNIANYGWFKSSASSFQSTIDEMNASPSQLPSAVGLIPLYGNENGVEYVEFLVENFSVFGMYAQTIDAPLPVTLTSFNAFCQGETIQLNWTTASEFNASHYIIQNSRNGFTWTDLGEVAAAGTTNQATNYSFKTKNFGGLSYFRLVQVDLDGTTEIFGPVSANCELENNSMTVYPNPTAENFSVRIETKESFEKATLELIDNMGRVVSSKTLDIEAGSTTIPFESRDLQAGVYILRMQGEGEKFKPLQVVKM